MLGYKCLHWNNLTDLPPLKVPETFSLPASIPQWPPGNSDSINSQLLLSAIRIAKTWFLFLNFTPISLNSTGFFNQI